MFICVKDLCAYSHSYIWRTLSFLDLSIATKKSMENKPVLVNGQQIRTPAFPLTFRIPVFSIATTQILDYNQASCLQEENPGTSTPNRIPVNSLPSSLNLRLGFNVPAPFIPSYSSNGWKDVWKFLFHSRKQWGTARSASCKVVLLHLILGELVLWEYFNRELIINCISSTTLEISCDHRSKLQQNPSWAEPPH